MKAYRGWAAMLLVCCAAPSLAETIGYSYDANGRLVQVVRSGSVNAGVSTTYTQDQAGNRTHVTVSGAPH